MRRKNKVFAPLCTVELLSRSLTRILQSYKASLGARKNRRRPLFSMLMAITLALVGCAAQCMLLVFSNLFPIYIFCQQQLQFSCNQIFTENNIQQMSLQLLVLTIFNKLLCKVLHFLVEWVTNVYICISSMGHKKPEITCL